MPAPYHDKMSVSESAMTWMSGHLDGVVLWLGPFAEAAAEAFIIFLCIAMMIGFICAIIYVTLGALFFSTWGACKMLVYAIERITRRIPTARDRVERHGACA